MPIQPTGSEASRSRRAGLWRSAKLTRLWLGLALLVVPPYIACATGTTEEDVDGGGGGPHGEGGGPGRDGGGGGDVEPGDSAPPPDTGPIDSPCGTPSCCSTVAQCPPMGHVMTTDCVDGSCVITACSSGWYDFDAGYSAGCDCKASGNPTTCATAMAVPSLTLGGSKMLSGNLPTPDAENWFQITFGGAPSNTAYHPQITLSKNPGKQFVFDVESDCAGATLSCADSDAAVGLTTWEEFWGAPDGGTGTTTPLPPVGAAGVVLVRVHRARAKGESCDDFELTVSD